VATQKKRATKKAKRPKFLSLLFCMYFEHPHLEATFLVDKDAEQKEDHVGVKLSITTLRLING